MSLQRIFSLPGSLKRACQIVAYYVRIILSGLLESLNENLFNSSKLKWIDLTYSSLLTSQTLHRIGNRCFYRLETDGY